MKWTYVKDWNKVETTCETKKCNMELITQENIYGISNGLFRCSVCGKEEIYMNARGACDDISLRED